MTPLRQRHTRSTYLLQVSLSARHFHQSTPAVIRNLAILISNGWKACLIKSKMYLTYFS